jgi:hypothetical protein
LIWDFFADGRSSALASETTMTWTREASASDAFLLHAESSKSKNVMIIKLRIE